MLAIIPSEKRPKQYTMDFEHFFDCKLGYVMRGFDILVPA